MTPKELFYENRGLNTVKQLRLRHFDAQYCKTAEEAKAAALALIAPEQTVGWGGSVTVDALGIKDVLRQRGQTLFDRDVATTPEEVEAAMKKSLTANVFLMSSNAITEDGCLVNLDGRGNRVAALTYGADRVIVIAGMNKVVPTVEDGITRTRHFAAPMNAQRFGGAPCAVTGCCADCKSEACICCSLVITRMCRIPGRIHVILVGEDLGM